MIIRALNKGGNHWVLIVSAVSHRGCTNYVSYFMVLPQAIELKNHNFYYLDPFGTTRSARGAFTALG